MQITCEYQKSVQVVGVNNHYIQYVRLFNYDVDMACFKQLSWLRFACKFACSSIKLLLELHGMRTPYKICLTHINLIMPSIHTVTGALVYALFCN